uniref:Uncharacterized protein n=1 Tax=Meloidogyne enterolobii TaxID=390850 RepID=A0A6V7V2A1_MELEN|nr:unnamed protein product [Meloidogyne enterolobii]
MKLLNSIDKLSASNGSLDNKKSPVKLFGPRKNSGSMSYNHQANNSGKKSEVVSLIKHPSNSSLNLNPTSGETYQNGDIEMVSANNTNEHRSATPPKTHKKSGCSKGSRFQTGHSMEFGSNQLVDSNREKNHKKHYSVDGKLVDKSTKKNPQRLGILVIGPYPNYALPIKILLKIIKWCLLTIMETKTNTQCQLTPLNKIFVKKNVFQNHLEFHV